MKKTPKSYSKYTEEEKAYFFEACERGISDETIAKKLGRTRMAIATMRRNLDVPCFTKCIDGMSIAQVAILVGLSKSYISRGWVKAKGLKVRKKGGFLICTEPDLLEFMKNNPNLWKAQDCDYYSFYQYPWFIEKLEQERNGITFGRKKQIPFSDYEISKAKAMRERGCKYQEIAEELNRRTSTIERMLKRENAKDGKRKEALKREETLNTAGADEEVQQYCS